MAIVVSKKITKYYLLGQELLRFSENDSPNSLVCEEVIHIFNKYATSNMLPPLLRFHVSNLLYMGYYYLYFAGKQNILISIYS